MMRARIADIIHHASQLSGVSMADITGPNRTRPVVRVRQAVCLIAKEQATCEGEGHSYPTIGRALGKRDHSTVIHACRVAENMAGRDPVYAEFVATLREIVATTPPFAQMSREPITITSGPPPRVRKPHIKAITLRKGEEPDAGHIFHQGIAKGSAALLEALAA